MPPSKNPPNDGRTTSRLRFEKARESDRQGFCRWYTDPVAMRYVTGEPLDDQQANLRFDAAREAGKAGPDLGFYSVRRIEDDAFVGVAKLTSFPSLADGRTLEVGYGLLPFAFGRGYATEIVGYLTEFVTGRTLATELVGITHRDHLASIRVLQKCGFEALHGDSRCPDGSLLSSLQLPSLSL
ncbi:MAG: GNAT family N-acetyltransferase [Planctomycetota bacterium]